MTELAAVTTILRALLLQLVRMNETEHLRAQI